MVVLSFSSFLILVNDDSDGPSGVSRWQYIIGFLYTLRAFALHSLSLSLMHLSLPKGSKKGNIFSGSGNANLYSTCCHLCFYCGKWKTFCMGMVGFAGGRVSYVMNLVWTAVAWQVCSVGVVLLCTSFVIVSSL